MRRQLDLADGLRSGVLVVKYERFMSRKQITWATLAGMRRKRRKEKFVVRKYTFIQIIHSKEDLEMN